ncbi:13603_t:CDS:1, partial [Cetraspora pellucida]
AKPSIKNFKIAIMNQQPINQAVGGQPLPPQNANVPVGSFYDNYDNLTAEQKYKILTEGAHPFPSSAGVQRTENQTVQFLDVIISGSCF